MTRCPAGGKAPTAKKAPQTKSLKAGLQFPVGRLHRFLKLRVTASQRVGATAAVYVRRSQNLSLKPPISLGSALFGLIL